jgi:hypothetical protein
MTSYFIPPPERGRSVCEANRVGVLSKVTPPQIAFGDPTLPLHGRVKKVGEAA